jgi:hypothetical protein
LINYSVDYVGICTEVVYHARTISTVEWRSVKLSTFTKFPVPLIHDDLNCSRIALVVMVGVCWSSGVASVDL